MFGSGHAKLHQAENQAHGREQQLPWRRGRLGLIIPLIAVLAFAAVVAYAFLSA